MRVKLDENLPRAATSLLRDAGHDADSVLDESLQGAADERIASACREERRALLTLDSDFSDVRRYPPGDHFGLIVLRPREQTIDGVIALIRRMLPQLEAADPAGQLWIVHEHEVRIRE
jgi:predicted nuclease of predicted toxin-antitoxin system